MEHREIERKWLIEKLPEDIENYQSHEIEQAYLCTAPVVRIRRQDDEYILTYKSKGFISRREENLPLTKEAYAHLREKADGRILTKRRYIIPIENGLKIELDVFSGDYEGLFLAEVEFADEESANAFQAPEWFGRDVTFSGEYHNSTMSRK